MWCHNNTILRLRACPATLSRMRKWSTIPVALFIGDVIVLYVTLVLALALRQQMIPTHETLLEHVVPFSLVFIVWVIVWYIAGLYEKRIALLRTELPKVLIRAQILNAGIAVIFFYLIPVLQITPKTLLFIYLGISLLGLFVWRRFTFRFVGFRNPEPAIIIGAGSEMRDIFREVNADKRFGIYFAAKIDVTNIDEIDFKTEVIDRVYAEGITTVVIDTGHESIRAILPRLYNLIFSQVQFIDMHKVYEEIFDRVPLSLVAYSWFLENISVTRRFSYEFLKRLFDISVSVPALLISLVVYPFVIAAIKLEDGGPIFFHQERIGKNSRVIRIAKFRTMTRRDTGAEALEGTNVITRVGAFLRKTRIDELPQLWDVVRGDLSLIGPRPEVPSLVAEYTKSVPFYNIRHLIKPGLSGWAQISDSDAPRQGVDVEKTQRKLSYDLYYLKNRSFILDFSIVLKTVRILISQTGK